jgi:hypothetical protein
MSSQPEEELLKESMKNDGLCKEYYEIKIYEMAYENAY